jgi:hypothetical protein
MAEGIEPIIMGMGIYNTTRLEAVITTGVHITRPLTAKTESGISGQVEKNLMNKQEEYMQYIGDELAKKYEQHTFKGIDCFTYNGFAFFVHSYKPDGAFFIEYFDNMEQAKQGIYPEDGDWFYISDMSKEEMLAAMVKEIEA